MDNTSLNASPSMDLPPPQQPTEKLPELDHAAPAEVPAVIATETVGNQPTAGGPPPGPISPISPAPTPGAQMPMQPVTAPLTTVAPAVAEDADLIEKEWVEKAKQIVAQTRHDPHLQNQEMNRFKADYLKKRYNKDMKVSG